MAKPLSHAQRSVRKWGGKIEDYIPIHNWFDQSKSAHASMAHRMVTHHSYGIFLCEQVFGTYITNSDSRLVSVRDVAEQHVLDDLGRIPSLDEWANALRRESWMFGYTKDTVKIVD